MLQRRLAGLAATLLAGPITVIVACGGAPTPPPATSDTPSTIASTPPAEPVASASAAPAPTESAGASEASSGPHCGDHEILDATSGKCVRAGCPEGQVLGDDGSCKAKAACIDGEEMMGACLCPHGKSVDDTGHCVPTPCPPGNSGGVVFRNDNGDCMECRPGTSPCGDKCCPGAKRAH